MGCIIPGRFSGRPPACTEEGIVLIFDEVMTGFRLGRQTQERLNIDAGNLRKVIRRRGIGAFGEKKGSHAAHHAPGAECTRRDPERQPAGDDRRLYVIKVSCTAILPYAKWKKKRNTWPTGCRRY